MHLSPEEIRMFPQKKKKPKKQISQNIFGNLSKLKMKIK